MTDSPFVLRDRRTRFGRRRDHVTMAMESPAYECGSCAWQLTASWAVLKKKGLFYPIHASGAFETTSIRLAIFAIRTGTGGAIALDTGCRNQIETSAIILSAGDEKAPVGSTSSREGGASDKCRNCWDG